MIHESRIHQQLSLYAKSKAEDQSQNVYSQKGAATPQKTVYPPPVCQTPNRYRISQSRGSDPESQKKKAWLRQNQAALQNIAPLSSSQGTTHKYPYVHTEPNDEFLDTAEQNFTSSGDETYHFGGATPAREEADLQFVHLHNEKAYFQEEIKSQSRDSTKRRSKANSSKRAQNAYFQGSGNRKANNQQAPHPRDSPSHNEQSMQNAIDRKTSSLKKQINSYYGGIGSKGGSPTSSIESDGRTYTDNRQFAVTEEFKEGRAGIAPWPAMKRPQHSQQEPPKRGHQKTNQMKQFNTFNNPDDRPIRPSPTTGLFGDPEKHHQENLRTAREDKESDSSPLKKTQKVLSPERVKSPRSKQQKVFSPSRVSNDSMYLKALTTQKQKSEHQPKEEKKAPGTVKANKKMMGISKLGKVDPALGPHSDRQMPRLSGGGKQEPSSHFTAGGRGLVPHKTTVNLFGQKKGSAEVSSSCLTVSERGSKLGKNDKHQRSPIKQSGFSGTYSHILNFDHGRSLESSTKRNKMAAKRSGGQTVQTMNSLDLESEPDGDHEQSQIFVNKIKNSNQTNANKFAAPGKGKRAPPSAGLRDKAGLGGLKSNKHQTSINPIQKTDPKPGGGLVKQGKSRASTSQSNLNSLHSTQKIISANLMTSSVQVKMDTKGLGGPKKKPAKMAGPVLHYSKSNSINQVLLQPSRSQIDATQKALKPRPSNPSATVLSQQIKNPVKKSSGAALQQKPKARVGTRAKVFVNLQSDNARSTSKHDRQVTEHHQVSLDDKGLNSFKNAKIYNNLKQQAEQESLSPVKKKGFSASNQSPPGSSTQKPSTKAPTKATGSVYFKNQNSSEVNLRRNEGQNLTSASVAKVMESKSIEVELKSAQRKRGLQHHQTTMSGRSSSRQQNEQMGQLTQRSGNNQDPLIGFTSRFPEAPSRASEGRVLSVASTTSKGGKVRSKMAITSLGKYPPRATFQITKAPIGKSKAKKGGNLTKIDLTDTILEPSETIKDRYSMPYVDSKPEGKSDSPEQKMFKGPLTKTNSSKSPILAVREVVETQFASLPTKIVLPAKGPLSSRSKGGDSRRDRSQTHHLPVSGHDQITGVPRKSPHHIDTFGQRQIQSNQNSLMNLKKEQHQNMKSNVSVASGADFHSQHGVSRHRPMRELSNLKQERDHRLVSKSLLKSQGVCSNHSLGGGDEHHGISEIDLGNKIQDLEKQLNHMNEVKSNSSQKRLRSSSYHRPQLNMVGLRHDHSGKLSNHSASQKQLHSKELVPPLNPAMLSLAQNPHIPRPQPHHARFNSGHMPVLQPGLQTASDAYAQPIGNPDMYQYNPVPQQQQIGQAWQQQQEQLVAHPSESALLQNFNSTTKKVMIVLQDPAHSQQQQQQNVTRKFSANNVTAAPPISPLQIAPMSNSTLEVPDPKHADMNPVHFYTRQEQLSQLPDKVPNFTSSVITNTISDNPADDPQRTFLNYPSHRMQGLTAPSGNAQEVFKQGNYREKSKSLKRNLTKHETMTEKMSRQLLQQSDTSQSRHMQSVNFTNHLSPGPEAISARKKRSRFGSDLESGN